MPDTTNTRRDVGEERAEALARLDHAFWAADFLRGEFYAQGDRFDVVLTGNGDPGDRVVARCATGDLAGKQNIAIALALNFVRSLLSSPGGSTGGGDWGAPATPSGSCPSDEALRSSSLRDYDPSRDALAVEAVAQHLAIRHVGSDGIDGGYDWQSSEAAFKRSFRMEAERILRVAVPALGIEARQGRDEGSVEDESPASRSEATPHPLPTPTHPGGEAEPSSGLLMSMAIRYDHALAVPGYYDRLPPGFGLPGSNAGGHASRLQSTLCTMRKLWEEVVGAGFYAPEREASYVERRDRILSSPPSTETEG